MRRIAVIAVLLITEGITAPASPGPVVPSAVYAGSSLAGKSGRGLAEAIRATARPARLCLPQEMDFTVTDPFGGTDVRLTHGSLPEGYVHGQTVPAVWWDDGGGYGDTVGRDLINYLPLGPDVALHRRDLPPGRSVDTPDFTSPRWQAGVSTIEGIDVGVYAPPAEWRGALARIYFYMATVYPSPLLRPGAFMMFTPTPWPGLTPYAAEMLLEWHAEWPPSQGEVMANDRAEALQGSRNPFVDYPSLPSYLWGDRAGEAFGLPGEPMPLHSTYAMSDQWIWLISPHVPASASWTIDGRGVTANPMSTSDAGAGTHRLAYTAEGSRGYVMIRITE